MLNMSQNDKKVLCCPSWLKYCIARLNCLYPGLATICVACLCMMSISACSSAEQEIGKAESAVDLEYDDSLDSEALWPDLDLKGRFITYWSKRFSTDSAKELMPFEAPHFQKMISMARYQAYLENFPGGELSKIKLYEPNELTEYYFEFPITVHYTHTRGDKKTFDMKDRWVKVDGVWYHLLRDPLFFPSVSANRPKRNSFYQYV